MRRAAALLAFGAVLPFACGGEDLGRPPVPTASPVDAGTSEACDDAQRFEFVSVLDFEGPPARSAAGTGSPALDGTALSCNPAVPREQTNGEGGAGGTGSGDAGASGGPGDVPVCRVNFNYENTTECNFDPVSSLGKPVVNLPTREPWVGLEVPGGRCGAATHAYHLEARNLGVCFNESNGRRGWGSNFVIDFTGGQNPTGLALDATGWTGVAFWGRLGDGPSNETITFQVGDSDTSGGEYAEPGPTGRTNCVTTDSTDDSVKCDPFGIVVTLTREWVLYRIPFEDLKQKGYGQQVPDGTIDRSRIWRMQIGTSTGDWDLYLDDIAFYRDKP